MDKVNKNAYKDYLGMVTANLNAMMATKKEDMKNTTHLTPLTTRGVATKLQGGMINKILISNDEHSRVLTQHTVFFSSAIEAIRRELIQYGLMISNLANETKHHRTKIS